MCPRSGTKSEHGVLSLRGQTGYPQVSRGQPQGAASENDERGRHSGEKMEFSLQAGPWIRQVN